MADQISSASVKVLFNGNELPLGLLSAIDEVTVEEEINLPAMFSIKVNSVDFEKGDFRGIDLTDIKPGDVVTIFMGIDKAEKIMVGEVTALDAEFGNYSTITVRGYDRLHRLRFGRKRRTFTEVKESDIASTIASDAGLTPSADDSGTTLPYVLQSNESDFDFLRSRAARIGYELMVDDKTLYFRKSKESETAGLTLAYGQDLDTFSVRLTVLTEGSTVDVRGWDVIGNQEIVASATSGDETTKMDGKESGFALSESSIAASTTARIEDSIIDATHAEQIAKGHYNALLKDFISGDGRCSGNNAIRAGKTIKVTGIGTRFSGTYYVTSTTHTFNKEGYHTQFKVKRTGI